MLQPVQCTGAAADPGGYGEDIVPTAQVTSWVHRVAGLRSCEFEGQASGVVCCVCQSDRATTHSSSTVHANALHRLTEGQRDCVVTGDSVPVTQA